MLKAPSLSRNVEFHSTSAAGRPLKTVTGVDMGYNEVHITHTRAHVETNRHTDNAKLCETAKWTQSKDEDSQSERADVRFGYFGSSGGP